MVLFIPYEACTHLAFLRTGEGEVLVISQTDPPGHTLEVESKNSFVLNVYNSMNENKGIRSRSSINRTNSFSSVPERVLFARWSSPSVELDLVPERATSVGCSERR